MKNKTEQINSTNYTQSEQHNTEMFPLSINEIVTNCFQQKKELTMLTPQKKKIKLFQLI